MKFFFISLSVTNILLSCQPTVLSYESTPKVDTHVHFRISDPSFLHILEEQNFKVLSICTRSSDQESIDNQLRHAYNLYQTNPERFGFATTFSMEGFEEPGWEAKTISRLKDDFESGALAVKVWKDIGMTFKDSTGNFIMIDNPKFDPVLEFISNENRTLIAHIGEPKNCWLPLEEMTVNNDRRYFKEHPEYHMYLHPDYPSYEDQIDARDRMLEKHPDLRVVAAHLASLEWDVDELAKRLERFPNLAADMAARICHFQVQDREKVRKFIIKYADRLLYATDIGLSEDDDFTTKEQDFTRTWRDDWTYFTTDSVLTSNAVSGSFQGLDLPAEVINHIYFKNSQTWFPNMWEP